MGFSLAPTAVLEGFRLEAHDTVSSTNAIAMERARQGDPGKLWIVSDHQQSGRGRRGREWVTPKGNLAATLLLVPTSDLRLSATLGFVAGLALADALAAVIPDGRISIGPDGGSGPHGNRFELKWPNDVLAHGSKLAGILLESTMLEGGRSALAIGIGVNVVAHPSEVPYPATSLKMMGAGCDAQTLFLALSDAWSENSRIWNEGAGLEQIRRRWLERAAGLGSQVAVRVDGNVLRGVFETIDEDCRFIIRDDKGEIVKITAGDVHFGAVASAAAV